MQYFAKELIYVIQYKNIILIYYIKQRLAHCLTSRPPVQLQLEVQFLCQHFTTTIFDNGNTAATFFSTAGALVVITV